MSPTWATELLAPTLGDVLAFGMWVASYPAVAEVKRTGNLGTLNPLPWAGIVLNCSGWLLYSYVVGGQTGNFMFFANAPGLLLGSDYVLTAVRVMPAGPDRRRVIRCFLASIAAWTLVAWLAFLTPYGVRNARTVVGVSACLGLCVFYAAPLSSLAAVVRAKDASSISGPLAAVSCLNGCCWTVYGYAIGDPFLFYPNACGAVLTTVQLLLRASFPAPADVGGALDKPFLGAADQDEGGARPGSEPEPEGWA